MSNVHDGGTIITGAANIENARRLALRRRLKLEIETGMKASRSAHTTLQLVCKVIGFDTKSKRRAYAALDAKIAAEIPGQTNVPLRPAR